MPLKLYPDGSLEYNPDTQAWLDFVQKLLAFGKRKKITKELEEALREALAVCPDIAMIMRITKKAELAGLDVTEIKNRTARIIKTRSPRDASIRGEVTKAKKSKVLAAGKSTKVTVSSKKANAKKPTAKTVTRKPPSVKTAAKKLPETKGARVRSR